MPAPASPLPRPRPFRARIYKASFIAVTLLACLILWPALFLPPSAARGIARWWLRTNSWLEHTILGLTWTVEGREHLPAGACIVAAKHQSAWETFKLYLLFDHPGVILKQELLRVPIWGGFLRRVGALGVDRAAGAAAMRQILEYGRRMRDEGRPLIIFPQGTRVPVGTWEPYKPGIVLLYRQLGLPVVPLAHNAGCFADRGGAHSGGRVTLRFLPPIPPGLRPEPFQEQLIASLEGAANDLALAVGGPATHLPPDAHRRRPAGDEISAQTAP